MTRGAVRHRERGPCDVAGGACRADPAVQGRAVAERAGICHVSGSHVSRLAGCQALPGNRMRGVCSMAPGGFASGRQTADRHIKPWIASRSSRRRRGMAALAISEIGLCSRTVECRVREGNHMGSHVPVTQRVVVAARQCAGCRSGRRCRDRRICSCCMTERAGHRIVQVC